jgi:plasmid stabilization system protein ParE
VKNVSVTFSDAAVADILKQSDWYEAQADRGVVQRWEKAVTATLLRITRQPQTGSPCRFASNELHGTRRLPVDGLAKPLILYK